MMVSFEHPQLGDAADELARCGPEFACEVLLYLQEVHSKAIAYRSLNPFYRFQGVEMFHASMAGSEFAIFAVEADDGGDLKVTLMLAGQRGSPMQVGPFSWDGFNFPSLKAGILNARAAVWFV
jgi:hypothetical protein